MIGDIQQVRAFLVDGQGRFYATLSCHPFLVASALRPNDIGWLLAENLPSYAVHEEAPGLGDLGPYTVDPANRRILLTEPQA